MVSGHWAHYQRCGPLWSAWVWRRVGLLKKVLIGAAVASPALRPCAAEVASMPQANSSSNLEHILFDRIASPFLVLFALKLVRLACW